MSEIESSRTKQSVRKDAGQRLFRTWSIDFGGPLKETGAGNKYLLRAVEHMSCCPVARAIGTEMFNGAGFIKFVEEKIFWLYGNPVRIVSDGYSKFDNKAVRDFATSSDIRWKIISSYNPRGHAKVERMVGTLMRAVQKVTASNMNQDCDICVGKILGGYRR